jgi:Domain of unknown function (DUF4430)
VFRRSLVFLAGFILVAGLASAAAAARIHIRIEGRTTTIFGSTQPFEQASTPLDALTVAARKGEFYYHVTQTAYGPYVDEIGLYHAFGSSGWAFKVNGVSPPVGADKVILKPDDSVLWYWAFFGLQGGPNTLVLKHHRHNCYRVFAQDDTGKHVPAPGAVLHAGHRHVKTHHGRGCIKHRYGVLVRATLHGRVRSNELK